MWVYVALVALGSVVFIGRVTLALLKRPRKN